MTQISVPAVACTACGEWEWPEVGESDEVPMFAARCHSALRHPKLFHEMTGHDVEASVADLSKTVNSLGLVPADLDCIGRAFHLLGQGDFEGAMALLDGRSAATRRLMRDTMLRFGSGRRP